MRVLALAMVLLKLSATSAIISKDEYVVAAYLPEWRYEGANWDTICEHTSHLIIFSLEMAPNGKIVALDRIPRPKLLAEAQTAAEKHGTKLILCFGGNGRSSGFAKMTTTKTARKRFIRELVGILLRFGFDGVDYNWEYPGYHFGKGYLPDAQVELEYEGLRLLVKETRSAFNALAAKQQQQQQQQGGKRAPPSIITLAYYPDGRQERLLAERKLGKYADLMHMMSYDQGKDHHSTLEYGASTAKQGAEILRASRLTLGLPFYGRSSKTGDWVTYEDIVQQQHPLSPALDTVQGQDGAALGFNGVATIAAKTKDALEQGLAGVMIWEVGQDCRLLPVTHGDTTHVRTCPSGPDSSLLVAITHAAAAAGKRLWGQIIPSDLDNHEEL